jgi:hypothetical protein
MLLVELKGSYVYNSLSPISVRNHFDSLNVPYILMYCKRSPFLSSFLSKVQAFLIFPPHIV